MKHWLRKHCYQRPRAMPRWWRMPDQYLLRYETRWAFRWLTRWPGILWLLFPIIFISTTKLCRIMSATTGLTGEVAGCLYANRFLIFLFTMFFLWLWLLQHRTFVMFSRQRIEDLVLTRFSTRQFWPAFLVPPVLIPGLVVFQVIIGFVAIDIAANASKAFSLEYLNRLTAPDVILYRALLNHVFATILLLAVTWTLLICIYATTARMAFKCLRKPSMRTVAVCLFGLLLRIEVFAFFLGIFVIAMATLEIYFLPIATYFIIVIVCLLRSIRRNIARLRAMDLFEILRGRTDPAGEIESEY